jgi:SAM-dependent methyltransferase
MGGSDNGNDELDALVSMARTAESFGAIDVDHLNGAAAAYNYIRIADLVSSYWSSQQISSPVLDWGCGYGQVSWLLERRQVPVVSCDVQERAARKSIPPLASLKVDVSENPVLLPYASGSFGAVLSVGVLEHVPDLAGSLQEVSRILKPNGIFFIFMFPNRFSWAEWIADVRGISVHPNKYTFRQTRELLERHGFKLERKWRRNLLPRNLTGLSSRMKAFYGRYYRQVESADRVLANSYPMGLFSGVLEGIARRA